MSEVRFWWGLLPPLARVAAVAAPAALLAGLAVLAIGGRQ